MFSFLDGGFSTISHKPEAEFSSGVSPSLKPIKRTRSSVSVLVPEKLPGLLGSIPVSPASPVKSTPEQRSTGGVHGAESLSRSCPSPLAYGKSLGGKLSTFGLSRLGCGLVCAVGIYSCFLLYGVLQERLCKRRYDYNGKEETFQYHVFIIFCQCVTSSIIGSFWAWYTGDRVSFGKNQTQVLVDFSLTSVSYVSAIMCSNVALRFVDYPTQVLGKSCKMVSVMFAGVLAGSARYTAREKMEVFMVTVGIFCFTYANHGPAALQKVDPSNSNLDPQGYFLYVGSALIFASLALDGVTGVTQDILVARHQPTSYQLMTFQNIWGALFSCFVLLVTGEGAVGLAFFFRHRGALLDLCLFSFCSAVGQIFIFVCVRQFGSLVCTTITTTRKFFSILFSVLWFHHSLSLLHWVGIVLVFCGLLGKILLGRGGGSSSKEAKLVRVGSRELSKSKGWSNSPRIKDAP